MLRRRAGQMLALSFLTTLLLMIFVARNTENTEDEIKLKKKVVSSFQPLQISFHNPRLFLADQRKTAGTTTA
jgi:hypothetical protein